MWMHQNQGEQLRSTRTTDYILSAATQGADIIDGLFLKGNINRLTDLPINADSVVLHEGRYYLASSDDSSEDFDSSVWLESLTEKSRVLVEVLFYWEIHYQSKEEEIAYESGVSFFCKLVIMYMIERVISFSWLRKM